MVMLVATSLYYNLIVLDRRARATNQVVSSLSFAMDTMARGIRTGYDYQCTTTGGNDTTGNCTSFSYSDTVLKTRVTYIKKASGSIGRCQGTPGNYSNLSCLDASASPLTDPGITIAKLSFYVRGVGNSAAPTWAQQPHVTFVISGRIPAGSKGEVVPFTIQEGATQRLLDY